MSGNNPSVSSRWEMPPRHMCYRQREELNRTFALTECRFCEADMEITSVVDVHRLFDTKPSAPPSGDDLEYAAECLTVD